MVPPRFSPASSNTGVSPGVLARLGSVALSMRCAVTPGPATIGSGTRIEKKIAPAAPAIANAATEKAIVEQRPGKNAPIISPPPRAG